MSGPMAKIIGFFDVFLVELVCLNAFEWNKNRLGALPPEEEKVCRVVFIQSWVCEFVKVAALK